ncbi:hypothetical protein XENOCAPTIV_001133, partial [Xenoophorus captivus]
MHRNKHITNIRNLNLTTPGESGDDAKIRVWQVPKGGLKETLTEPKLVLQDGKLLATVCKDGKVRVYDPRNSTAPVQVCHCIFVFSQEGPGPEGHRGARVVWVCDGKYLLVSGFDKYWKISPFKLQSSCDRAAFTRKSNPSFLSSVLSFSVAVKEDFI